MHILEKDALRIGIYVRTIVQNQERLERQEEICRAYAQSIGGTIGAVYRDDGYSALFLERPALQQMLEDIKGERKFDLLIVQDLFHLARDYWDLFHLFSCLKQHGVGCVDMFGKNLVPNDDTMKCIRWEIEAMMISDDLDTFILMPSGKWWTLKELETRRYDKHYGIEQLY
ncbi:recombinase family protein [Christensenellaceae bacterium OttesenSCG-928-K19]|nr:recombinase family protein [Christensenellaceae bacterium OttesenSCG-928-K19]